MILSSSVAVAEERRKGSKTMSSGVSGANDMMASLIGILMQGMQQQTNMSQKAIAVGVENSIVADKMALAQNIIDVYA